MTAVKIPVRQEFDFTYQTSGLTAGVDTGIIIPDGGLAYGVLVITTTFNGTNAEIAVGTSQANATNADAEAVLIQGNSTDSEVGAGSHGYIGGNNMTFVYARGGDLHLWVALLNSSAGGAPAGNNQGVGKLIVCVAP